MDHPPETTISNDELLRILKIAEEAGWEEIELTTKDFKFVAGKSFPRDSNPSLAHASPPPLSAPEKTKPVSESPSDGAGAAGPLPATTPGAPPKNEAEVDGEPIKAPMMGMFYRAPSPGAPPFVEVGDTVTEHSIVGIIEVMKIMSSIEAGLRGRISAVLVENGQLVQYNQPLFLIDGGGEPVQTT